MKFLVDRCAGYHLAEWLRQAGHDVVEVRERHPDPGDQAVLAWAVAEERIVVTIDTDFGELIFAYSLPHCGLVRLPDVPADQRIALMGRVLTAYSDDLETKSIVTIRGQRIRISKADPT
jgi:predicted nuclease of predicted toxin-antitoxin system